MRSNKLGVRIGAFLAPFLAACARHPGLTAPRAAPTTTPVASVAITPSPAVRAESPPNQREPENPLLPIPLHLLPAETREIRVESTAERQRTFSEAICGWPDLESRLLDTTPTNQTREVADALRNADATRSGLACRHELRNLLGSVTSVRSIVMKLPSSSSEPVYFLTATKTEMPAPSYAHDGATLVGVPGAKCIYDFRFPRDGCTNLSDGVARSPEGDFWILGRIAGLSTVVESMRATDAKHPSSEQLARLITAGDGLEIESIGFDARDLLRMSVNLQNESGFVSGRDRNGARVKRIVLSSDADADTVEKALRAECDKDAHSSPGTVYDCHDCAPMIRAAWVRRETASARVRRIPLVERNARVITWTTPTATDPELTDAKKAFDETQAKRQQLVDSILDAWRNGTVPAPSDFAAAEGPEFVRGLKDELLR